MNKDFLKNFMQRNWFILWVVNIIVITIFVLLYFRFESTTEKISNEFSRLSKSVIMLSPTGTVILQKRTVITEYSKPFQKAVAKILATHLIASGSQLTNGYNNVPANIRDLVMNYPPFKEFYENFLTESGKIDFARYARIILSLINQDNYPDEISILGVNINSFDVTKKGFDITVGVDVYTQSYLVEQNKVVKGRGTITINASGYFDPQKGSIINPLGVMFTKLNVTVLKKR